MRESWLSDRTENEIIQQYANAFHSDAINSLWARSR